jgi:site-specific DNA-methyltransferase (adenine-specific)
MNRHESEWLDLRRMDNMELMRQFPDKHFDLAIVDPPYGIVGESGKSNPTSRIARHGQMVTVNDTKPPEQYWRELFRVSQNQIVWGGNYFHLPPTRGFIFWHKHQPVDTYADGEYAWTSFNVNAKCFDHPYFGGGAGFEGKRIHSCQKPVALYRWLIANYAKPGQKILDTHLGSGSIAIACHYARLHLTACELDEDYFAASIARIKRETAQESFDFDAAAAS